MPDPIDYTDYSIAGSDAHGGGGVTLDCDRPECVTTLKQLVPWERVSELLRIIEEHHIGCRCGMEFESLPWRFGMGSEDDLPCTCTWMDEEQTEVSLDIECPSHNTYSYRGAVQWWNWPEYEGYYPDSIDGKEADIIWGGAETGVSISLPVDAVVGWFRNKQPLKVGQFVRIERGVAHPTNYSDQANGVVIKSAEADDVVLVAVGVGVQPVPYVLPDTLPPLPLKDRS